MGGLRSPSPCRQIFYTRQQFAVCNREPLLLHFIGIWINIEPRCDILRRLRLWAQFLTGAGSGVERTVELGSPQACWAHLSPWMLRVTNKQTSLGRVGGRYSFAGTHHWTFTSTAHSLQQVAASRLNAFLPHIATFCDAAGVGRATANTRLFRRFLFTAGSVPKSLNA